MGERTPRVSVGVPVFNGERFLEEALRSILSQTFEDFEVVISDNASTDGTQELCRTYAARDPRIRYHRNERNVGGAANFNRVLALARGEYHKWAAYDDVIAPDFLARCVDVLDHDGSVVLCYSRTKFIDENGQFVREYDVDMRLDSSQPHVRFHDFVCTDHWPFQIFGLTHTSMLRKVPPLGRYIGSDRNLLAELVLLGRFQKLPDALFHFRDHPQISTRLYPDFGTRMAWWDPARAGQMNFPVWRRLVEYFKSVKRAPLDAREQWACYAHITEWLVGTRRMRGRWRLLARDLQIAGQWLASQGIGRRPIATGVGEPAPGAGTYSATDQRRGGVG